MVGYRDFLPREMRPAGFFRPAEYETFPAAVAAANDWIQRNSIQVINVETVVLPNLYNPGEEGSGDADIRTSGEMASHWYQFLRVWYETP